MLRNRSGRTFAIAVIALALASSACSGLGSKTTSKPAASGSTSTGKIVEGGQLRIGTTDGVDNTNPYKALLQDSYSAFAYIYPLLVQYDPTDTHFVPDFATSWTKSPDGKVWTFHTVPRKDEPGVETWQDDSWQYTGNTALTVHFAERIKTAYNRALEDGQKTRDLGGQLGTQEFADAVIERLR
jgi:ABC-type oligopeptide transport system substrate-binding subunit